jgi:hypothetical protein
MIFEREGINPFLVVECKGDTDVFFLRGLYYLISYFFPSKQPCERRDFAGNCLGIYVPIGLNLSHPLLCLKLQFLRITVIETISKQFQNSSSFRRSKFWRNLSNSKIVVSE